MREYLLTNIRGSYSNMETEGGLKRMYAGYLVASLTPPQDRVVVLEWVNETISVAGRGPKSGECSEFGRGPKSGDCSGLGRGSDLGMDSDPGRGSDLGRTYTPSTLPGLEHVEYAEDCFVAEMKFTSALLNITKNVVLDDSSDTVKIVWKYNNISEHDLTVSLEPWLSFRRPDTPAKPGETKFKSLYSGTSDTSGSGNDCFKEASAAQSDGKALSTTLPKNRAFTGIFVPEGSTYPDKPCMIALTVKAQSTELKAGAHTGSNTGCPYFSSPRYTEDERTGEPDTPLYGSCYVPYSFEAVIPAGSSAVLSLVCSVRRIPDELTPSFKTGESEPSCASDGAKSSSTSGETEPSFTSGESGSPCTSGGTEPSCTSGEVKSSSTSGGTEPSFTSGGTESPCLEYIREFIQSAGSFLGTPIRSLRQRRREEWDSLFSQSSSELIHYCFDSKHSVTAALYDKLLISAPKFITMKSGTSFKTVMAGYPWFLDWGRDTMIAFPGLLLVTGQFDTAKDVLRSFARYVRNGMVPNVFPSNSCEEPQYNTVDASLWFFYAADMYTDFSEDEDFIRKELLPVLRQIIDLYSRPREAITEDKLCYGIYMDSEGLVHAGIDESDQLTWMDVRIDGKAVTPRHDCPVEIQALMYNALQVMLYYDREDEERTERYQELADRMKASAMLYYNPEKHCLYDCISGEPGNRTSSSELRPNQIFAASMPFSMYSEEIRKEIIASVRDNLVTELGIRSLAPSERGYIGKYEGCLRSRDRAYHNGTAWGFLTGHFILAVVRTDPHDYGMLEYIHRMLRPYLTHCLDDGCVYGIAEVFDGDAPTEGKGCYNQAWSVGCLLEGIYAMYAE